MKKPLNRNFTSALLAGSLGLFGLGSSCWAAVSAATVGGASAVQHANLDEVMTDDRSVYAPEPSYFRGTFGFEADGYLYSPRTKSNDIYPSLMARSSGRTESGFFEFFQSSEAIVMSPVSQNGAPSPYFELPELYVATSPRMEDMKISLGRKIQDWNHLDEHWKLGIWQPRYRWDYLRPDTVGLTGLTVELERPLFRAVAFGSLLYIPERGAPIGTENGQLISSSPWFIAPPNHIQVISRSTPLSYNIQTPPMSQILLHPSAAGMIRIGDRTGPWMSGGYAYKPMNQLLLAFDGHLILSDDPNVQSVADVPIVPRVVYHHLISAEAGFTSETLTAWISVLKDQPGDEATPLLSGTYTLQQVSSSTAVSPTIEVRIQDPNDNKMKGSLSYLIQQGGTAPSSSSDIPGSDSVFEQRYPFHNAAMFGGEVEMPGLAHSLLNWNGDTIFSTQVLYDIDNRGAIVSLDARYRPSSRWEANIGLDLLGSQDAAQSAGQPADDFIGRYRGNDRLRCGVTYVF